MTEEAWCFYAFGLRARAVSRAAACSELQLAAYGMHMAAWPEWSCMCCMPCVRCVLLPIGKAAATLRRAVSQDCHRRCHMHWRQPRGLCTFSK